MVAKRMRILPAGLAEDLSPAEQAHIDSGGTAALAPDATAPDAPQESDAAPASAPEPPPVVDASAATPRGEPEPSGDTKPKMVPHAALHEERELRKAAEKRAQLLEDRATALYEALRRGDLTASPAPPATAAPGAAPGAALPPFETDPTGHLRARLESQAQLVQTLLAGELQRQHMSALAQQQTATVTRANTLIQAYAKDNPDYPEAASYLTRARERQLTTLGIIDPAMRRQLLANEGGAIVNQALQLDKNPGELIYALAQELGYRKAVAAPAPGDAAERLRTVASGQRQGASLGALRGSGPHPLTAQRLLEMSDAEFARAIATPEGRALLGA